MPDKFDQEDPFKKYGGNQIEDPFKKYGGKAIEEPLKKKVGGVGSLIGGGAIQSGTTYLDKPQDDWAAFSARLQPMPIVQSEDPIKDAVNRENQNLFSLQSEGSSKNPLERFQGIQQSQAKLAALNNPFIGNAKEAAEYLSQKKGVTVNNSADIEGLVDKNNYTETKALGALKNVENINNAIATSPTIEDAAVKYQASQDDLTGKQAKFLQGDIPDEVKGKWVQNFLNNHEVVKLAEHDPEFAAKIKETEDDLYKKYPKFGIVSVRNKIAQEREDRGGNSLFANNPSVDKTQKLVDEMLKRGHTYDGQPFTQKDAEVWEQYIKPNLEAASKVGGGSSVIPTPDVAEGLSGGLKEGINSIGSTLKNIASFSDTKRQQELTRDAILNEYSTVGVNPKSEVGKVFYGAGHLTGFLAPMILGNMAGVPNLATNTLMFMGTNIDNGRRIFPTNKVKQAGYAALGTAADVLLAEALPMPKGAKTALGNDIKTIINDFTDKKISAEVAKESFLQALKRKLPESIYKTAEGNTKTAGIITGFGVVHNALDAVFGGRKVSFDQAAGEALDQFKTNFFAATPLSVLHAAGGKKNIDQTRGQIFLEAAADPEKFREAVNANENLSDAQKKESLQNIDHIEAMGSLLDKRGVTPEQKEQYLVKSVDSLVAQKAAKESPDKVLAKEQDNAAKIADIEKERILNPEITNTEHIEKLYDFLPKGYQEMLSKDGKFDPSKVGGFIKEVAQQLNGLDENWQPQKVSGKAALENLPDSIKEIANDKYADEIEAAQPKEEPAEPLMPEGNRVPEETPQEKSGVSVIMPEDNRPPNVVPLVKAAEPVVEEVKPATDIPKASKELPLEESPEVIEKKMKPITDYMVEIEREFNNNGYDIDWDYDSEIIIRDKKTGEQVDLDELPEQLIDLASVYEKNTKLLGAYDHESMVNSLNNSRKVIDVEAEIIPTKEIGGEEPPKAPPTEPTEKESGGLNDKGVLNRLVNSKHISEEVRTMLREAGLKYEPVGHQESQAFAKSIVDELGINEAVRLAEANKFKGGTNTAVFAESMDRLYDQEMNAKTPEEKLEIAKQSAEIGIRMDEFEREKGRDISQIAYFYKKSPLGMQMMENAKRKQEFDNWAKPKEKSWKEVYDEMMKEPEFDAIIKEQVKEGMKQERAAARATRKKKVDDFFDKAKDQFKGGAAYSTIIPPKVITTALEGMRKAYHAGEAVAKIIEDAVDYISDQLGGVSWDKDKFRKEWEGKLGKETDKSGIVNRDKRIEYLKKELARIQSRRQKEKVESTEAKRQISDEEQVLLDEIEAEQTKWDAEKDAARNAANDYQKLETERNRQLKRVDEINKKIDVLRQGKLPETKSFEPKKDTPEIEALKAEKDALEASIRQSIAHEKKMKGLEDELQRLKDRKEKEPKTKNKREITEDERLLRDEIEAERKAWAIEDNINSLKEELERVKSRQKKTTNPSQKRELTAEEKDLVQKIKAEKLLWQKEVEPERKLRDALKATQKSIEEYERRIREKDISKKESDVPETPELKALREKRDAKRKEYEAMKKEMKKPSDEELATLAKKRFLDKLSKKLKGLTDKQKEEVVRKAFKQIVDAGALEYDDFRQIIADVTGRGEMTPEQSKQLKELVDKTNAVEAAAKKAQEERTDKALEAYYAAQLEAGKASRELNDLLYNKPDIVKRLTSIMQLNTLGVASLVRNPVYNIFNQSLVRFPVGLFNDLVDRSLAAAAKLLGKNYDREYNILETQGEFWSKLGFGSKEAVKQLFTGLNRMDYTQKEVYGQQIRPMRAIKDLYAAATGKKKLTSRQVTDKALQATVGVPAEVVARVLNLGDKPQRFAAEGSQAAAFAKMLGIKDIDRKIFMEFPKEEAYRVYKSKGLSDAEASKKAEYIYNAIIKEGERSTFQQDNYLNDIINRAMGVLGGEKSGWANLFKTLTISPYIKIPSNAFWSGYNLLNPEVAVLQSLIYGGASKAMKAKGRADNAPEMAMREARYWMGHAVAGIALRTVVLSLVSQGIFTPSSQKDDSKREREGAKFFTNTGTVDMGKLMALLNGEDPSKVKNGLKITNNWFGQLGYMGDAIARKYQDMTPEQREKQDKFWATVIGGMEAEGLQDLQNGVFANTSAILNSLGNPTNGNQYLLGVVGMAMNIVQPATLAQLSRAEMPYYTTAGSGDFLKKLENATLQRSSLLRNLTGKYPPSKIDIWGQTMERRGSTMQKYFGISRDNPDAFARPLFEDYQRTGDIKFLPPAVYPNIGKEKLTDDQYARLQTYIGGARKMLVSPYVNDNAVLEVIGKKYSDIKDDDTKLEVLNYLYELGRKEGMNKFMSDFKQFQKKDPNWKLNLDDDLLDSWKSLQKKLQKYKTE